jgi:RNA polymerase sigma factor (sigma-70 family)
MTVGQLELVDSLPDTHAESPEEKVMEGEERERCIDLLSSLSPRSRDIISWRYGFVEFPGEEGSEENIRGEFQTLAVISHTAIALYLGLSRERIRQLENEALGKLRATIEKAKKRKRKK